MSDALITIFFLTLSGGLQDAYTYFVRGGVFANGQTGNIVLMSAKLFDGDFKGALRYMAAVSAFALGIFLAENISNIFRHYKRIHWRQIVLLAEICLLTLVAFLPQSANIPANAIVSFTCALQVESFRKVNGHPFASTMCIGNLKSGIEALSRWRRSSSSAEAHKALHYFLIISIFAVGAGIGAALAGRLADKLILLSPVFLSFSLLIMFADGSKTDAGGIN